MENNTKDADYIQSIIDKSHSYLPIIQKKVLNWLKQNKIGITKFTLYSTQFEFVVNDYRKVKTVENYLKILIDYKIIYEYIINYDNDNVFIDTDITYIKKL